MTRSASKTCPPVDRRTVLRGAAWSVPVIATAVAVPVFADTTTRTNFGPVVESSDNIGYATAPVSSLIFDSKDPAGFTAQNYTISYTFTYTGSGDFRFTGSTLSGGGNGWALTVSADGKSATLTRVQLFNSWYMTVTGATVIYDTNLPQPEQGSIVASCYAISADDRYEFGGLTRPDGSQVSGPRTPALRQAPAPTAQW